MNSTDPVSVINITTCSACTVYVACNIQDMHYMQSMTYPYNTCVDSAVQCNLFYVGAGTSSVRVQRNNLAAQPCEAKAGQSTCGLCGDSIPVHRQ